MKKFWLVVVFSLVAGGLPALSFRLVSDIWQPFTGPDNRDPGFMVELAGTILKRLGYDWNYERLPWTRALRNTVSGEADILISVPDYQAKAEGLVLCSEPFAFTTTDFFTTADSKWTFGGIASLHGQILGIVQDYTYAPELDLYITKNRARPDVISIASGDNPIEVSLRHLVSGRSTVLVDDRLVVLQTATSLGLDKGLRWAGRLGQPTPLFLAISPNRPWAADLARQLATALVAFKKTPEFTQLLAKYGVAPW